MGKVVLLLIQIFSAALFVATALFLTVLLVAILASSSITYIDKRRRK